MATNWCRCRKASEYDDRSPSVPEEPRYRDHFYGRDRISREARFIRQSVQDGFRLAGSLLLCRQVYDKRDHDYKGVPYCRYCYDPVLKQRSDSRCPHCFGTGFANGGYGERFMVRAHIQENNQFDEKVETQGLKQEQQVQLKLPVEPIFRNGDVFAEVRVNERGVPYEIGRVFQLDGPVTRKTVQGVVSDVQLDAMQRLEDIMVSQEGQAKILLDTDERYLRSDEFWGVSLVPNPDPYADYEIPTLDGMDERDRYHAAVWRV